MDWHQLEQFSGIIAPLAGIALTWLNRQWFIKMLVPQMVLVAENRALHETVKRMSYTNTALIAQAEGWRGAARAADYVRKEADDLRERVSTLESSTEITKQTNLALQKKVHDAILHIQDLYAFIADAGIQATGGHKLPILPESLKEDLPP